MSTLPETIGIIKDDEFLKSFTAKDAQNLAKKLLNTEVKIKMGTYKKQCIESIKKSISFRQSECIFTIDNGTGSDDVFYKYFKNELKFFIIKSPLKENEFTIQWHTDETKRLTEKEIRDAAVRHERAERHEIFTVYHALMFEKETHELFISSVQQKLIISCMSRIVEAIASNTKSFIFEIPFLELGLDKQVDRSLVFDKLVEEITRRKFNTSDLVKIYGSMRIYIPSVPEITIEEVSLSATGGLQPEPHTPPMVAKDYSIRPTKREETASLLKDLFDFITERAQILVHSRCLGEQGLSLSQKEETRLTSLEENIHKIIATILGCFP
jgi:hypothetical protein